MRQARAVTVRALVKAAVRTAVVAGIGTACPAAGLRAEVPEAVQSFETSSGPVAVESVAEGLEHPWGMAFLPDGRLLVTERPGRLRIVATDGEVLSPLKGVPEVLARGQGGLLDVALDPGFEDNRLVWLSFAEPGEGGASTALGRGRLTEGGIEGFQVIFRQEPKVEGYGHFGGRIVFDTEDAVFLTLGERFKFDPAQDLSDHLGTIVRVRRDGSIPDDNPFTQMKAARPEIWSYGHRNIEGAARHPETDELWIAEMGPRGGDELNRIRAGTNYGWPVVSWGRHYGGGDIPDPPTQPDFTDAVKQWTPVIAPSGMIFYRGDAFPEWRGDAFIGGLVSQGLVRLRIEEGQVRDEERISLAYRIRDVEEGPDGALYVLTDRDDGAVWRLKPGTGKN